MKTETIDTTKSGLPLAATPLFSGVQDEDDGEELTGCCGAPFYEPGWPDCDICSECKEHACPADDEAENAGCRPAASGSPLARITARRCEIDFARECIEKLQRMAAYSPTGTLSGNVYVWLLDAADSIGDELELCDEANA